MPSWTPEQIAEARKLCDQEFRDAMERAANAAPPTRAEFKQVWDRMANAPLQPSCGPTPPWWTKAVEWADHQRIWVENFGFMEEALWEYLKANDEYLKGRAT